MCACSWNRIGAVACTRAQRCPALARGDLVVIVVAAVDRGCSGEPRSVTLWQRVGWVITSALCGHEGRIWRAGSIANDDAPTISHRLALRPFGRIGSVRVRTVGSVAVDETGLDRDDRSFPGKQDDVSEGYVDQADLSRLVKIESSFCLFQSSGFNIHWRIQNKISAT